MTFNEARAELKEIAQGEYRSMYYEVCDHGHGDPDGTEVRCRVYVHPNISSGTFRTWRGALDDLKEIMNPSHKGGVDIEEAPDESTVDTDNQ